MLSGPDVGKPAICDIDFAICGAEVRTGRSNLAAAVPHRREFAIEVPEQQKNTCVAAHAVKVGDIAPSLVKFLMTLLLVFSGFAWSALPPSSSHLTNLSLAYPLT